MGIDDDDVAEALAAARARARRELEALPAIVAELASAIERVAKLGAEEEWLVALEAARIVPPFAAGEVLARTMEDARGLLPRLGENVRAELERTAAWASGDEAEPDQPTGFVVGELTYREARTMRRPEGGEGA